MMGSKARLFTPVVAVSLDELVPPDHFYRHLDRVLDLSFVRDLVKDLYAVAGRPSVDPIVFFKLQLVMFFEDIRSERLLMRLVADKLSVRWYVGYNLDEPLPDHSSLTRIRQRFGLEIFRRYFDAIVEQCQQAGLVWGKELYFDSTQVLANADLDSLTPRFAVEARAALQTHLTTLFPPDSLPTEPEENRFPEPPVLPVRLTDTQRAELVSQNEARHDWVAEAGQPQREAHGIYQRTSHFKISTTDPDATPMQLKGGGVHLGYHAHYVVDGGKRRIILAALVVPGEVQDNQPMRDLLWHVQFRWHRRPEQVTGDTKYGTIANLRAIEEAGIHAYLPLSREKGPAGYWTISHFQYEPEADQYRCPQGTILKRITQTSEQVIYRAPRSVCNYCPVKAQCTPSSQGRRVSRLIGAEYAERVQTYQPTEAYQKALRKRQVWVEPLFGEAKQWHGLRQFRLRRLWKVNSEALLTASGQNLKRLLQHRGWGRRPIPTGAAGQAILAVLVVAWPRKSHVNTPQGPIQRLIKGSVRADLPMQVAGIINRTNNSRQAAS